MRKRKARLTLVELFAASNRGREAFTLVELLVVIGIIALLIGILLPALNRAREKGRQAQCLSNVRQISMAFFMYTNENKGWFPAPAVFGNQLGSETTNVTATWIGRPEDWIAWRQKQPDDPLEGAIVPYLNNASPAVMRCPSDDPTNRTQVDPFGGPFPYSYNMNSYLSFGAVYHPAADDISLRTPETGGANANTKGWNNIRAANRWGVAWKIQQVKNSSDKIIVYEVDERFLKDGRAQMQNPPVGQGNSKNYISMVAIRHDTRRIDPDDPVIGPNTIDTNPNVDRRGNCGFVDGHADFVSRREAHSDAHYIPKL